MLRSTLPLLFAVLFCYCKKQTTRSEVFYYEPRFTRSIPLKTAAPDTLYVTNTTFSNNFYILAVGQDKIVEVLKCDMQGKQLFQKIMTTEHKFMGAAASRISEEFYTVSGSFNFSVSSGPSVSAYTFEPVFYDSSSCNKINESWNYVFTLSVGTKNFTEGTNSILFKKFDGSGNELWSKTLPGNYSRGKNIETDTLGNIYVLAAHFDNSYQNKNEELSGIIPYYFYEHESCSYDLYKFDANGNQIFKNSIGNINATVRDGFNPQLAISRNLVIISGQSFIHRFDHNGNLITRRRPSLDRCNNTGFIIAASPKSENAMCFSLITNSSANSGNAFIKLKNNTESGFRFWVRESGTFVGVDANDNTFWNLHGDLTKRSGFGDIIFEKKINVQFDAGLVDNYNSFYSFTRDVTGVTIKKYDNEGNSN